MEEIKTQNTDDSNIRDNLRERVQELSDRLNSVELSGNPDAETQRFSLMRFNFGVKQQNLRNNILQLAEIGQEIISNYRKHSDGTVGIKIPKELEVLPGESPVHIAGLALNSLALLKGQSHLVFWEPVLNKEGSLAQNLRENESNPQTRTDAGCDYSFRIVFDDKVRRGEYPRTRDEQMEEFGVGAPMGIMAIAEACQRLKESTSSLFLYPGSVGGEVLPQNSYIRGLTPNMALFSGGRMGVHLTFLKDDTPSNFNIIGYGRLA